MLSRSLHHGAITLAVGRHPDKIARAKGYTYRVRDDAYMTARSGEYPILASRGTVRVPRGYWPAFDGVRAVSVVAVLVFHTGSGLGAGGLFGVDAFFVLSGFLITLILFRHREAIEMGHLCAFYIRRALRLFPALFVLLAFCACFGRFTSGPYSSNTLHAIVPTLGYASNWYLSVGGGQLGLLSPTWSLAVEEQFYLVWPGALWFLMWRNCSPRTILTVPLAGFAISAILRAWLWHQGAGEARVYFGSDTRGDALLIGCAVGVVFIEGHRYLRTIAPHLRVTATYVAAPFIAIVFVHGLSGAETMYGGLVVLHLAMATVILSLAFSPPRAVEAVLSMRPLVMIGKVSYGMYLWQWPVVVLTRLYLPSLPKKACLVFVLVVTITVAVISYAAIERPFLRLKARLASSGVLPAETSGRIERHHGRPRG